MSLIDFRDDIRATSLWPTDQIVDVIRGSFDTATAEKVVDPIFGDPIYARKRVEHNFTRPVFCKLKWSLDGINWVDGGLGQLQSDPLIYGIAWSDSNEVNIFATLVIGTFYYEVTCIWITDYDTSNPLVEPFTDPTKPFVFNSEDNLQKLFMHDDTTFSSTSEAKTIEHGLRYLPNVWVFFESNPGEVWPAIVGGVENIWLYNYDTQGELDYQIDDTNLYLEWEAGFSFTGTARAWYRIYVDD